MISAQQLRCANHGPEPEDCFAWVIPLWQCGGNIALCGNCGNVWQCVCHWWQLPPPGVNNVAWQPRPLARPGSHTLAVVMSAVPPPVQCRSEMGGCWRLQPACLTTSFCKSNTFSVRYIKILSWEWEKTCYLHSPLDTDPRSHQIVTIYFHLLSLSIVYLAFLLEQQHLVSRV